MQSAQNEIVNSQRHCYLESEFSIYKSMHSQLQHTHMTLNLDELCVAEYT